MTLKELIQQDFILAMKNKDSVAKLSLSGIKAKIVEFEKEKNVEAADEDVIKVITKAMTQREESAKIYIEQSRPDLAEAELAEAAEMKKYLPAALTDTEIEEAITKIAQEFSGLPNENARRGKTMGEFNKRFMGRADITKVKEIISRFVS